jgi:hypothetical protein
MAYRTGALSAAPLAAPQPRWIKGPKSIMDQHPRAPQYEETRMAAPKAAYNQGKA